MSINIIQPIHPSLTLTLAFIVHVVLVDICAQVPRHLACMWVLRPVNKTLQEPAAVEPNVL
jgi:hypothetical protein